MVSSVFPNLKFFIRRFFPRPQFVGGDLSMAYGNLGKKISVFAVFVGRDGNFRSFGSYFCPALLKDRIFMVNWTSRGDATGKKSDKKKTHLVDDSQKKIEKANFDIPKRPP